MAITAIQIESSNSLEQFRQEFNNLQSDVSGLETGTISFAAITTTSSNTTTLNVREDGTIVFEGATDDGFETTLTVADPTADRTITFPDAAGTVALTSDISTTATNVTVTANNSTNETIFLTFVDGATGTQGIETDTGLTYNPSTGLLTSAKLLVADDGTIGSASSTSAITISSAGIVTLVDDLIIKDAGTIGSASATGAIAISSGGIVTFVDDILIKDGGTIGVASTAAAITIASDGDITTSADLTIGALFKMPDVTSTKILVADGTSFQEVAISGDVTIANTGAVTIAANAVEGSMLNDNTISGQTALTSGLATTDELLVSDGGTLKRMDVSVLTALTDASSADSAVALAIALG